MTALWHSLYLSCDDREAVAAALRESLTELGYQLYDPFGLMPGRAYARTVRLFVASPAANWTRVIGVPDEQQIPALSRLGLCLTIGLEKSEAHIAVYVDQNPVDPETALIPHLRAGYTADHLRRALHDTPADHRSAPPEDGLPLDILPDDLQAMAGKVNMKQAQKMFARFSSRLLKNDQSAAARDLIAAVPDWNSPGGRRIAALMACLTVPVHWRDPDFVTLRDAYQLHVRRRRSPNALLYPGDAEAMAKVPDALDYVPVYGGMDA